MIRGTACHRLQMAPFHFSDTRSSSVQYGNMFMFSEVLRQATTSPSIRLPRSFNAKDS